MTPQQHQELKDSIRDAGGIVHSDGNIFFTNAEQFLIAASAQPKQRLVDTLTRLDVASTEGGVEQQTDIE